MHWTHWSALGLIRSFARYRWHYILKLWSKHIPEKACFGQISKRHFWVVCLLQLKRKCTKRNLASNIYNSNIPPCLCDGRRFLPGHDIWWGLFSTGQRETGGCPDSNFQSFHICTALLTRDGIPLWVWVYNLHTQLELLRKLRKLITISNIKWFMYLYQFFCSIEYKREQSRHSKISVQFGSVNQGPVKFGLVKPSNFHNPSKRTFQGL